MIGDGIDDGDFIFVQKQNQATPGEIVVAWIDGEATVKRYYPNGRIASAFPTLQWSRFTYAKRTSENLRFRRGLWALQEDVLGPPGLMLT